MLSFFSGKLSSIVSVYKFDLFDQNYNEHNFLINHNTLSIYDEHFVECFSAFNVKRSGKMSPPQLLGSRNIQLFVKFENKFLPPSEPAPLPSKQDLKRLKGPNTT